MGVRLKEPVSLKALDIVLVEHALVLALCLSFGKAALKRLLTYTFLGYCCIALICSKSLPVDVDAIG